MNELRNLAQYHQIKTIATCDAHYATPEQAEDHRVLLCSSLKTTLKKVKEQIENQQKVGLDGFFKSERFHIPTPDEMLIYGNTVEEIENTQLVADQCETYNILGPPQLPKYQWTDGKTEDEYLKDLCRQGWLHRSIKEKSNYSQYIETIKKELDVIIQAKLSGYFLIVQDYVKYAKKQGWLVGPCRGSAGGCLVAYLLGITTIDPVENGLIFERFYNAARTKSLPDIDVDFPISKRDQVIQYIKDKYGHDRVAQMVTFGRLMGRAALKEVLRVHEACSFGEMNIVTQAIPQEAEISDQLQDADTNSVITWALQHTPELLNSYCTMDQNGKCYGEYARYFEQAIRLEGTYKSTGKHAAGLIISAQPLNEVCPMVHDKHSNEKIAGMGMGDLESMGHVKFDILGVALLDKLMAVNNLLKYGKIEND
jgi:DNA polymerase-3 subunit alpha